VTLWAIGLGMGLSLAAGAVAGAHWIVSIVGGANGAEATAQTLPTGGTPTASVSPASNPGVAISFTQSVSSGGTALTAYDATRYLMGST
jgi:hypothetical protein